MTEKITKHQKTKEQLQKEYAELRQLFYSEIKRMMLILLEKEKKLGEMK